MYNLETRLEEVEIENKMTGDRISLSKYFQLIGGDIIGVRVDLEGSKIYVNCLEDNFKWILPLVETHYYTFYRFWTDRDKLDIALKIVQKLTQDNDYGKIETVKDFILLVNAIISNL